MTGTIDAALNKFTLISGNVGAEERNEACAMTALAWVAGEAWTDHPECAHRWIADLAITGNDDPAATVDDRRAIVRAGQDGVLDTWWIPDAVVAGCIALAQGDRKVDKTLDLIDLIAWWKAERRRPNLREANLQEANLREANLQEANLREANLQEANLREADLRGADLREANLQEADLWGANLQGADLRGADLREANLRGAKLWGAKLWGAKLQGADLRGADLRGAKLWGADLRGAKLWGAKLWGAKLQGADLRGAKLQGAKANSATQWPGGFDPSRLDA